MIHANAAKNIFNNGLEINVDSSDQNVEFVREHCSHLCFVAATMLCLNTPPWIDILSEVADFIEKLDLPVVAFGIGNSTEKKELKLSDAFIDPRSIRLLRVIAERAQSVAVRGEFTAELCKMAGVSNVEVVGCQSIYHSAALNPPSSWHHREKTGRIAASITPTVDLSDIIAFCMHNDVDIIGQDEMLEYNILKGQAPVASAGTNRDMSSEFAKRLSFRIPTQEYCDYITSNFHKFFDVETWISHIGDNYDFAFGTRFHGNVAALQSGVPALWLTHDIRTIELCEHFKLPNISAEQFGSSNSIQSLKDLTDFSEFENLLPSRIKQFLAYLEINQATPFLSNKFIEGLSLWQN